VLGSQLDFGTAVLLFRFGGCDFLVVRPGKSVPTSGRFQFSQRLHGNEKAGAAEPIIPNKQQLRLSVFAIRGGWLLFILNQALIGGILPHPWGLSRGFSHYLNGWDGSYSSTISSRSIRRSSRRSNSWLRDRRSSFSSAISTSSTVSGAGGSCPRSLIRANAWRAGWLRLWVLGIFNFFSSP